MSADRNMADAARILLMTLDEKADLTDRAVMAIFGAAARGILATAWSSTPENSPLATAGIRFTARIRRPRAPYCNVSSTTGLKSTPHRRLRRWRRA